jgi:hypothetical protein
MHGLKAKLLHARRYSEKVLMKKTIKAHEERDVKAKDNEIMPEGALPTYLLDREGTNDAKALSSAIKQKRKEKAGKFAVPLPKVRGIAEDEMFKVVKTGKTKRKGVSLIDKFPHPNTDCWPISLSSSHPLSLSPALPLSLLFLCFPLFQWKR